MDSQEIHKLLQTKSVFGSQLLFLHKEDQEKWWRNIQHNETYRPLLDEIRQDAESLQKENYNPDLTYSLFKIYQESGSRVEYQKVYFAKRRRLNTFAIMSLLEPERTDYIKKLQDAIWAILDEYTWCLPAHLRDSSPELLPKENSTRRSLLNPTCSGYTIDLFAAETAFTLSEILQLTRSYLDPIVSERIYEEVYNRIFWPYIQGEFWWESLTNNWAAVCAGSVGSAALYLIEDNKELSMILEPILTTLKSYLSGFKDDGVSLEGYGYWRYGFGYYTYFADLLKRKTGGALNLLKTEKVH